MSTVAERIKAHTAEKNRKRGGPDSRARPVDSQVIHKATDLLDLIAQSDKSAAVQALRAGLKAKKRIFLGKGAGWGDEPDYRVRHESAMAILAYAYGKPIERQIVATGTFQELSEILTRISASPEARRELADIMPSASMPTEKP